MSNLQLSSIEFVRNAFVLVPDDDSEHDLKTTLLPSSNPKKKHRIFCSCSPGKTPCCAHSTRIVSLYENFTAATGSGDVDALLRGSQVRQVFGDINRTTQCPLDQLEVVTAEDEHESLPVRFRGEVVILYHERGAGRQRFTGRISTVPFSRGWLMNRARSLVETEHETAMRERGHLTIGQREEAGLWNRLAYHCFREFSPGAATWALHIDEVTGRVQLRCAVNGEDKFTVALPAGSESGVLEAIRRFHWCDEWWDTSGIEREVLFCINESATGLQCIPVVDCGNNELVPVNAATVFGSMVYMPPKKRLYQLSYASVQRVAAGWGSAVQIPDDDLSGFLEQHRDTLSLGGGENSAETVQQLDLFGRQGCDDLKRIVGRHLVTAFDRIELQPRSVTHGKWNIAIVYRAGEMTISLPELLAAKEHGKRFCCTGAALVDLRSSGVVQTLAHARGIGADGTVELSNVSLLQLRGSPAMLRFDGDERLIKKIRRMLDGKPDKEYTAPGGLEVTLRPYQRNGVMWLLFLYDYHLGGMLCDEMGLGKTIQTIAFFLAVKEQRDRCATMLVACPTSVASHWMRLVARFAPALKMVDYSATRQLPEVYDVVVLSYGILRNDIDDLDRHYFDIIVLDEAHQLKNRDTGICRAAERLRGRVVAGLTGTPVENRPEDLRTLFHLVLPGIMVDMPSEEALFNAVEGSSDSGELVRFRQRIEPFMLRRSKQAVLTELPPKIEEKRWCLLSGAQADLYAAAVRERGGPLVEALRSDTVAVPYMHVFALLTYLKQLCDTPALVSGDWRRYDTAESGKWDLFRELLGEALESGQKVVVFTQFLEMAEIIRHYCESISAGCVVLTGKTRDRAAVVKEFEENEQCRVFIGTIMAGGVGIDLVAASVVIHYDRWWNASKENQATDRVHRIGQKNGVQVFKLITGNTIEERIDRLIEQKQRLAKLTLTDDDPDSVKQFSRQELIELLSG